MTTITLQPTTTSEFLDWGDDGIWSPQVVPNGAAVSVIAPTLVEGGLTEYYELEVRPGETYSISSLSLAASNRLTVYGALTVTGAVTANSNIFVTGTFDAGSLEASAGLIGSGAVTVSGALSASDMTGIGLTVSARSLAVSGDVVADGDLTINVDAGGFSDFSNGALTGGVYVSNAGGALDMNVGGVLATLAATLVLSGGSVDFYNPTAGRYIDIADTLRTIAAGGVLHLTPGAAQPFEALTDNGQIILDATPVFHPATLQIGAAGVLTGANRYNGPATETVAGKVVNDGVIAVEGEYFDDSVQTVAPTDLIIAKTVTGSGQFEFVTPPADVYAVIDPDAYAAGTLELQGGQFENVVFNGVGVDTLLLDDPAQYLGKLVAPALTTPYAFDVDLQGVDAADVTGYSYSGGPASGKLVIDTTTGDFTLNFVGHLATSDFTLSAASASKLQIAVALGAAPALSGQTAQASFAGPGAHAPYSALVVTGSGELTATVTLSGPKAGALSLANPSSYGVTEVPYNTATGRLTLTGDAAEITAALDALTFTPSFANVAAGLARPTELALSVSNADGTATASTSLLDYNGVTVAAALAGDRGSFTAVADTRSHLSALSAAQISALASLGITKLVSIDGSVTYKTAASNAIVAAGLALGAPADDSATEQFSDKTVAYEFNAAGLLGARATTVGGQVDTLVYQGGSLYGDDYASYDVLTSGGQVEGITYYQKPAKILATEYSAVPGESGYHFSDGDVIYDFTSAVTPSRFIFGSQTGNLTIYGYDDPVVASRVVIDLTLDFTSFGAAQAAMTSEAGSTLITESEGGVVRFVDVAPSQLSAKQLGFG